MAFGGVPGGSSSSLDAIRRLLKYRAADCASATPLRSDDSASAEDVVKMEELSAELLATESADAVRLKLEDESRGKLSDSGQGGDAGVGDDAVSFMTKFWLDVGCYGISPVWLIKQSLVGSSSTLVTGGVSAFKSRKPAKRFGDFGAKKSEK